MPTADGIMLAATAASIARMTARLAARGIATDVATVDGLDIVGQHNRIAEAFMGSEATHLLFVDSDMAFPPDLAERLLAGGHLLAGCIYPKRRLDLARLERLATGRPFGEALALAYEWNVHLLPNGVQLSDGWCEVAALPGGFVLIARACLEALIAAGDVPAAPGGTGPRLFYREHRDGEAIYDLDYSLCLRWRAVGGTVWAYAAADIRHLGDSRDAPPFAALLAAHRRGAGLAPVQ